MNLTTFYKGGSSKGEPGFRFNFEYDAKFVERFKLVIPHTHREWNPETKTWWVAQEYEHVLNNMFSNFHALYHLQGKLF